MKNRLLLATTITALAAGSAVAQCVDTLYLTDLTIYHMSVVNSKVRGVWDSSKVNPWDLNAIQKAGYPVFPVYQRNFPFSYAVSHPRTVYFGCDQAGASRVSSVSSVVVRDSSWQDSNYDMNYRRSVSLDSTALVGMTKIGATSFGFTGGSENFDGAWTTADQRFTLGLKADGSIVTYVSYSAGAYLPSGFNQWESMSLYYNYLYPARGSSEAIVTKNLGIAAPYVDSIPLRKYDSTWVESVIYGYTFSKVKPPAASVGARERPATFQVQMLSGSVRIQLDQARSVSIASPEGRIARRLEATASPVWDLRDAAGMRVRPGIWYVHAEGLGTRSVVVR